MRLLQNRPTLSKFFIFAGILIGGGLVLGTILAGYSVPWTGFADYAPPNSDVVRGKTLWDWMDLLVVPLFLAAGAFYLNYSERKSERQRVEENTKIERENATDRQQEAALQAYLDRMAELLLKGKVGDSEDERVLKVKRVRTLTVMRGLNAARNGIVLRFLRDVGLVGNLESKLLVNANLEGADLEGANLASTNLQGASLHGANLKFAFLKGAQLAGANLQEADLLGAQVQDADLQGAVLIGVNLIGADLQRANLHEAILPDVVLQGADLRGATMPGGTKHD